MIWITFPYSGRRSDLLPDFARGHRADDADGFLQNPDYTEWVRAIGTGDPRDFDALRIGPGPHQPNGDFEYEPGTGRPGSPGPRPTHRILTPDPDPDVRGWESQGAGLTFDLEEPDAASVTSQNGGPVPLQKVFRGVTPGVDVGPYLSQFMLIGNRGLGDVHAIADGKIAYGSITIDQQVRVVASPPTT